MLWWPTFFNPTKYSKFKKKTKEFLPYLRFCSKPLSDKFIYLSFGLKPIHTKYIRCIMYYTLYYVLYVVPTQVDKMREELAGLNHCAVPFLSRAAANFK